ncbi:MAG: response regulator transcription factor [Lewinellaceae bacterium]|nr:response regulator transcription factor [Lewinellaceae bacterium]
MIKAVLVDDEKHSLATLAWKLDKFCPEVEIVAQFTDSHEALEYLRNTPPDLVFLDIEMPRLNGFEVLEEFGGQAPFEVIFTTAYDEFGIRAVKVNALDYLLKPVQNQELKDALEKFLRKGNKAMQVLFSNQKEATPPMPDRIALATKESIEFVAPEDIILCTSDSNYTMIHLTNGRKKLISKTLKDVEEWLAPFNFFRAHHSHLVNLQHIREYVRADGGYLLLSNKMTLPVARNRKDELLKMIKAEH